MEKSSEELKRNIRFKRKNLSLDNKEDRKIRKIIGVKKK